jgi:hypothetical protein
MLTGKFPLSFQPEKIFMLSTYREDYESQRPAPGFSIQNSDAGKACFAGSTSARGASQEPMNNPPQAAGNSTRRD